MERLVALALLAGLARCSVPVAFPDYGFRADTAPPLDADPGDADAVVDGAGDEECPPGQVRCGAACVDPGASDAHCGGCDQPCGAGQRCTAGRCLCADDRTPCAGACVVTRSDPAHCGACGVVCSLAAATSACVEGRCVVTACEAGAGDCDGDDANGCETTLGTATRHCGACGRACGLAHATAVCAGGTCAVGACEGPWGNCDGDDTNGCESALDTSLAHCGACGAACALPHAVTACAAGRCVVAGCEAGYGDCDGVAANGCETATGSASAHCGRCGNACPAGQFCNLGACGLRCDPPLLRCAPMATACVDPRSDAAHCGACGNACPAGQVCVASRCACPAGQTNCAGTCRATGAVCTSSGAGGCQQSGTIVCAGTGTACSASARTSGACSSPAGGVCTAGGACACPSGQTACGGVCRTTGTRCPTSGSMACGAGSGSVVCSGSGTTCTGTLRRSGTCACGATSGLCTCSASGACVEAYVDLCTDTCFSRCLRIPGGTGGALRVPNLGAYGRNDELSSVRLVNVARVVLYRDGNFSGASLTLTRSCADLHDRGLCDGVRCGVASDGRNIGDQSSSVEVIP